MDHSQEPGETAQPVVALARMLEGMAAMQERQAVMHAEQLEALRAQTSLQTQALLQLAAAGETSSRERQTGPPVALHLPKMTPEDDAEAFLEGFEVAARAQQAAHSLPPPARAVYANLKKAVLDRLGYSPEEHRRRFREMALAGADRPFAYAQRLLDMARRWLRPELRSADGVVELVTLERFIDGLPGETANWVRYHRPTGLAATVSLAEDHLALYPRGQLQQQQQQQQGRADPALRRRALPRSHPSPLSSSLPRAQTPSFSRNNPFVPVSPAPGSVAAGCDPQRAPQTPGPGCWRCGQPGHLRRECPLMEVGQVVRVVGPPTSAPDPDGAYCIPTDASDRGLGAVLTQQVEGVDRPVLYISRKLSQREAKYSTVEKECLAIRPGARMVVADFLSRPQEEEGGRGGGLVIGRMAPRPKSGSGVSLGFLKARPEAGERRIANDKTATEL
ncbi:uncharacterized protein LOC135253968 [Anguilla rostrata]|uniref:uncharacterized protein LOC135253968 n=1 Tax=Anguilla rostrata TaxID=7938 RepID=UPI0030CE2B6F